VIQSGKIENKKQMEETVNTCWKCGQPLPEGKLECDLACTSRMSEEDTEEFALFLQQLAKRRRLDWSSVQSLADVICVLSTLFGEATVDPDSAVARKLERFLEPRKEDDRE
jgi:hypothetical protein